MSHDDRIPRLCRVLQEAGVDAYLARMPVTLAYLAGFHEEAGERFLAFAIRSADGATRLIAPALSETQARRAGIEDVRPWRDGEDPIAHFQQLAQDWNLRTAMIAVDDEMPAAMVLAMQDALPAALFRAGYPQLSQLMRAKDAAELRQMQRAADIADEAFEAVFPRIRAGQSEQEVARMLFAEMEARGGQPTFAIVATGPNGAEPHHHTDATPLREGEVTILDFGCQVSGYQSDITRTIAIGHASPEAERVYALVLAAHQAGRAAVRPGVLAKDVDRTARLVIEEGGHGPEFFHRLGHGIGMRIHEEPNIIGTSDVALVPGDCFSIEPGIYLAGRFGVRVENIVTVTPDGCRSFNREPSETLLVA